jgi:hypothetical protein
MFISKQFCEVLLVVCLLKKFPDSLDPKIHYRLHTTPPTKFILGQMQANHAEHKLWTSSLYFLRSPVISTLCLLIFPQPKFRPYNDTQNYNMWDERELEKIFLRVLHMTHQ